jgi:hypothetical protein
MAEKDPLKSGVMCAGAIELPPRLRPGDRIRVLRGPFRDQLAIYAGMSGRERVAIMLRLLGGDRRILLHRSDVNMQWNQLEYKAVLD